MLWILLLAAAAVAGAAPADQHTFLVSHGRVLTYPQSGLKSVAWPLVWAGAVDASERLNDTVPLYARGRRLHWTLAAPTTTTWTVSLDATQARFAAWRYLHVNNLSMTYSHTPAAWHARSVLGRWTCNSSAIFCDAGVRTLSVANLSVRLLIDPSSARGRLPPFLYLLLTNGGAAQSESVTAAVRALAASTDCVHDVEEPALTICDDDVPTHFDMHTDPDTLVVGGTYWRTRIGHAQLDQWTGTLTVQAAVVPANGLRLAGSIVCFVLLFFVYLWLWASNTDSAVSYSAYLALPPADRRWWPTNVQATVAGWLLLPATATGLVLAWVAQSQAVPLPTLLTGPQLWLMLVFTSVYGALQAVLATALFVGDDLAGRWRRRDWSDYHVESERAWCRHALYGPAITAAAALCLWPELLAGAASGDRYVAFILMFVLYASVLHHLYYVPGLLLFVIMDKRARGAVGLRLLAVVEVVLGFAWLAVLAWFFLQPVLNASSAFFDAQAVLAGALLATCTGAVFVLGLAVLEIAATHDLLRRTAQDSL